MNTSNISQPILLFDGYCNLCNSSVNFIIKNERKPNIYFASLQSETGKSLLKKYKINREKTDSMVFIENNNAHIRSIAALKLSKHLKGIYPFLYIFYFTPKFFRDNIYNFISRNRYYWFGKLETCIIPEKSITERFLQ